MLETYYLQFQAYCHLIVGHKPATKKQLEDNPEAQGPAFTQRTDDMDYAVELGEIPEPNFKITDQHGYIGTALSRLESLCPALVGMAKDRLDAAIELIQK